MPARRQAHSQAVLFPRQADVDPAADGRIFDRIVDEVLHHLPQTVQICLDERRNPEPLPSSVTTLYDKAKAAMPSCGYKALHLAHGGSRQLREIDQTQVQLDRSSFQIGYLQKLLGEVLQMLRRVLNRLQKLLMLCG